LSPIIHRYQHFDYPSHTRYVNRDGNCNNEPSKHSDHNLVYSQPKRFIDNDTKFPLHQQFQCFYSIPASQQYHRLHHRNRLYLPCRRLDIQGHEMLREPLWAYQRRVSHTRCITSRKDR